jgi:hypothetical protein
LFIVITGIRKNEKYIVEFSDVIELDNEMIEFEFKKLQASIRFDGMYY